MRVVSVLVSITLVALATFVVADHSLFFGGQFILANGTAEPFASFGEISLNDDGDEGKFVNTGFGIFDSSTISDIAIYPSSTTVYLVGNFLWADSEYSSVVVSMDAKTFNLTPMGRGIATTSAQQQYVTALQSGDAVVGGSFTNIPTLPNTPFPNLAMYVAQTKQWATLQDPNNVWPSNQVVKGLASYQNTVFVYGADQNLYMWAGVGFTVIATSIELQENSLITDTSGNLYATNTRLIAGEMGFVSQDVITMWNPPQYNFPTEYIARESTVSCTPVLLAPYKGRIVAAIANNDTCDTWHFGFLTTDNKVVPIATTIDLVVTKFVSSETDSLVVSGPQNSNLVVESLFYLSAGSDTWAPINVGFTNFVTKSIAYCDAAGGLLMDLVDVDVNNRTLLFYSPDTQVIKTALSDQQLVKPGILTGIAQLSSGEIGVAGKFSFAGRQRISNAAVLNKNTWTDISFSFPPKANLPQSAVGLAASGSNFFTAGADVMLEQNSPLPLYYRSIKGSWSIIPNAPTSAGPSSKPFVTTVYASGDDVYFGGLLNAQVGSNEAVGVVSYNTKSKSWRTYGIARAGFVGLVKTIARFSHYMVIGGTFEFYVNGTKYTQAAAYDLSKNAFLPPTAGQSLTGINTVNAFGYHTPSHTTFILGNLVAQSPPIEPTGALQYFYQNDTFVNAFVVPTVQSAAYDSKQLYIGGSITGAGFAGVARWSGSDWVSVTGSPVTWRFEGGVSTLLLTHKDPKPVKSGMPGWAIALITIGSLIGAAILIGIVGFAAFYFHKRSKNYETL